MQRLIPTAVAGLLALTAARSLPAAPPATAASRPAKDEVFARYREANNRLSDLVARAGVADRRRQQAAAEAESAAANVEALRQVTGEANPGLQAAAQKLAAARDAVARADAEFRQIGTQQNETRSEADDYFRQYEQIREDERLASAEDDLAKIDERVQAAANTADAVAALTRAVNAAKAEALRQQFIVAKNAAEEMHNGITVGREAAAAVAEADGKVERLRAEYEQLQLAAALDRVKQERGAFADRNPAPGEVGGQVLQTEFFRGYLDLVARYRDLADDPLQAKVAAVVTAADVLRDQGPQAAIDFFTPLATQTLDPAVGRLIHLQLAEAYLAAGRKQDALDQYSLVILGARTRPAE